MDIELTLVLLKQDLSFFGNIVDQDRMASDEAIWSGSTLFSPLNEWMLTNGMLQVNMIKYGRSVCVDPEGGTGGPDPPPWKITKTDGWWPIYSGTCIWILYPLINLKKKKPLKFGPPLTKLSGSAHGVLFIKIYSMTGQLIVLQTLLYKKEIDVLSFNREAGRHIYWNKYGFNIFFIILIFNEYRSLQGPISSIKFVRYILNCAYVVFWEVRTSVSSKHLKLFVRTKMCVSLKTSYF